VPFLTEISGPEVHEWPAPRWIFEQIEEWARRSQDRIAFVLDHQDKIEEYRYADVLRLAEQTASTFIENGIQTGDHVGVLMENVPHWVFALLGAMRIGAVTVPLPTTLPDHSIELIVRHAGCKAIVADETNWEKATRAAALIGCVVISSVPLEKRESRRSRQGGAHTDTGRVPDPLAAARPVPLFKGDNTALLIYTSGTTGNPKGVELTFDNLNNEIRGAAESLQLTPNHRILSILPFSHVLPLIANGLGPLCIGATVVFLSSISPNRIIEAFHRHRITLFICVPQFFYVLHRRIFSEAAAQSLLVRTAFNLMRTIARRINNRAFRRRLFAKIHRTIGPDLQMLASGGSHFDASVGEDFTDLGYTVLQAYGLTETSAAATVTPVENNRVGSVGKPIRGVTIRIAEPNQKGIGEVLIRGPVVMKGYYRAPEKTAEVIKAGWFYSGDLGLIDQDGYLSITGRSKDVIVLANGENVYPEELETHYSKSPYIKEICILGISENGGSHDGVLHAIVVPDMDEFRRRGQTAIMDSVRDRKSFEASTFVLSNPLTGRSQRASPENGHAKAEAFRNRTGRNAAEERERIEVVCSNPNPA
jgi:long-chain acyl-CoA synthetase